MILLVCYVSFPPLVYFINIEFQFEKPKFLIIVEARPFDHVGPESQLPNSYTCWILQFALFGFSCYEMFH